MGLPDFLKGEFKENTSSEFSEAMERYRKHFGVRVSTAELVMSREEIVDILSYADVDNNVGAIMKVVMPKLKGKADGKLINKVVEDILKKQG